MSCRLTPALLRSACNLLFDFVGQPAPLFFRHPLAVYHTDHPGDVTALLALAEQAALAGHWVGGFITYEAAAAFGLPVSLHRSLPLLWLALFAQAEEAILLPPTGWQAPALQLNCPPERYRQDLQAILAYIARGDSYQVNYTLTGALADCDPASLFLALHSAHRHPYSAWMQCDALTVASLSPELLLQRRGDSLLTAPIKGTIARADDPEEDGRLATALSASAKERAEHLMIVDMARNDLGRVCRTGSVQVQQLFGQRLFASVQHLESRVVGVQRPGTSWRQLMAALFPAASITGAPKRRTMQIIEQLEQQARGIYTGSLFLLQPGGDLTCNVAIRTITWQQGQPGRLGLGGGIVADSQAGREWQELAEKSHFLHHLPPPLQLIETLLLQADGTLPGLQAHWRRLQQSARVLGFVCDLAQIEQSLSQQVALWQQEGKEEWIVRLRLSPDGQFSWQRRPRPLPPRQLAVRLSPRTVDRLDHLLPHKTNRRQLFEQALALAKAGGEAEGLLCNQLGHVTEGSVRAIAVRRGQRWQVPPLRDGLLASLWRQTMIEELQAEEGSLTVADLLQADEVRMGNSVQGSAQVVRLCDATGRLLKAWGVGESGCSGTDWK
ncbi:MAG: bifunctional anthranilate synthase component I family protein/class IV aminotransferase [Magnetococcales bacterium]|nr:bifunctional anthranilate synthase component I family protein/class IV aminotransferase [Magnetococcales bacterium]